jgi:hypothetical protein
VVTWIRFLVWLDIGLFIYWFYGRSHSPLADAAEQAATPAVEKLANFVTMLGALTLFNGFFMTLLGYMTEFGITTEATARWGEIGVTPEDADTLGLIVLAAGAAVFIVGRVLSRAGGRRVQPR